MRSAVVLLGLTALASAAPTSRQWTGPVALDDDILISKREVVSVEITAASTSPFTNAVVTKVTKYASGAADMVRHSEIFGGEPISIADGNGEIISASYGHRISSFAGTDSRRHRHHRHRISLLGFRDRLAMFILSFSLLLAIFCSYLRRMYAPSARKQSEDPCVDSAVAEKVILQKNVTAGEQ